MRRISGVYLAAALWVLAAVGAAHAADLGMPDLPPTPVGDTGATVRAPFRWAGDEETRNRAVGCLADAIYYEAGNQPLEGRQAVAQVVMNRVGSPNYPKSVCEVVYQGAPKRGCQFTFACDGSLARSRAGQAWSEAIGVAERSIAGFVDEAVGASDHYHTTWVHPYWSKILTPTVRIGAHQFYRSPTLSEGGLKLASAYAGHEPLIAFRRLAPSRASRSARIATPPSPQAATFSVWGVAIARVVPHGAELAYAPSGT